MYKSVEIIAIFCLKSNQIFQKQSAKWISLGCYVAAAASGHEQFISSHGGLRQQWLKKTYCLFFLNYYFSGVRVDSCT